MLQSKQTWCLDPSLLAAIESYTNVGREGFWGSMLALNLGRHDGEILFLDSTEFSAVVGRNLRTSLNFSSRSSGMQRGWGPSLRTEMSRSLFAKWQQLAIFLVGFLTDFLGHHHRRLQAYLFTSLLDFYSTFITL